VLSRWRFLEKCFEPVDVAARSDARCRQDHVEPRTGTEVDDWSAPSVVCGPKVGDRRFVVSRYHDYMTKQTTVRLPDELADQAEAVARVRGTSINSVIVESLKAEIERVRSDKDFTDRAKRLLERDRELLERLAR